MSDLEDFKRMLDSSGHGYMEDEEVVWRYIVPNTHPKEVGSIKVAYTVTTNQGTFYDVLEGAFDKAGNLLELISHVALGTPQSDRMKEYINKGGEYD